MHRTIGEEMLKRSRARVVALGESTLTVERATALLEMVQEDLKTKQKVDDNTVKCIEAAMHKPMEMRVGQPVKALRISMAGDRLYVLDYRHKRHVFSTRTGTPVTLRAIDTESAAVFGNYILLSMHNHEVRNPKANGATGPLYHHKGIVYHTVHAAIADRYVTAGADGILVVRQCDNATVRVFNMPVMRMLSVALSSDGTAVAAVCADRTVRVYDVDLGNMVMEWGGTSDTPGVLAVNKDGRHVAFTHGMDHQQVKVLTRENLLFTDATTQRITAMIFSPDGTMFVIANRTGALVFYDVASSVLPQMVLQVYTALEDITAMTFNRELSALYYSSASGVVHCIDIPAFTRRNSQ